MQSPSMQCLVASAAHWMLQLHMTHVCVCMQSAYSASKAGLNALSEGMRRELKPFGIGVVIIAPGALKSSCIIIKFMAIVQQLQIHGEHPAMPAASAL